MFDQKKVTHTHTHRQIRYIEKSTPIRKRVQSKIVGGRIEEILFSIRPKEYFFPALIFIYNPLRDLKKYFLK